MLPISMPLTLTDFARRPDEWSYLAQYLSLADLGRVCSVSTTFRDAVTPGMMERAALEQIRQEEGRAVSTGDLQGFRIHPATRPWADAGRHATACVASLYHVRAEMGAGQVSVSQGAIDLPGTLHGLGLIPQPRDGRVIAWYADPDSRQARWMIISNEPWQPLPLPSGLIPHWNSMGCMSTTRQFLVSQADWRVVTNLARELHLYQAETGEQVALPLVRRPDSSLLAACSWNGRFVAMVEYSSEGADTVVQCYDREEDRFFVDVRLAGSLPHHQVSVASDGRVFVAGYQGNLRLQPSGEMVFCPHERPVGPTEVGRTIYRISADEHFLIQSDMRAGRCIGDLSLMHDGQSIPLPRGEVTLPDQPGTHPIGIAFSVLNAFAAVVYQDGLIQVFDLQQVTEQGAPVRATAVVSCGYRLGDAAIRFDGFGQVSTIFSYRTEQGPRLGRHVLFLGRHEHG
ncbi:hypothetical protein [Microvirgula aerodenitrificans]|uniref:hypothetical protein n=1 Tax=Microvirgula aerodenitrificans TaxID=57480 RepID=UPI00248DA193|nr:hypothetical protein [Microvirgula aerodenitrificans]